MSYWVWTPRGINRGEWGGFAAGMFFALVGAFLAFAAYYVLVKMNSPLMAGFASIFAAAMLFLGVTMAFGALNYIKSETLRKVVFTDDGQMVIYNEGQRTCGVRHGRSQAVRHLYGGHLGRAARHVLQHHNKLSGRDHRG
ncbi:MAG: hypothetical protein QXP98_07395 [Thermoproteus sp.]